MSNSTLLEAVSGYVLGSAELISVILGLVLNSLTIAHFFKNRRQFTSRLYFLIILTDILILCSCFPSALSMLKRKAPMLLKSWIVCMLSGFIFNIFSRMSVFLIAMLSFTRAVKLASPFTAIKSAIYMAVLLVYFILNVCLASLPLIFSTTKYYYTAFFAQCTWGINELSFVNSSTSDLWYSMTYTTIILPWLLPGLVVILSCIFSVAVLFKSHYSRRQQMRNLRRIRKRVALQTISKERTEGIQKETDDSSTWGKDPTGERSERNNTRASTPHATVTIMIMTMVYIVFNVPCWLLYCYLLATGFDSLTWTRDFNVDVLQLAFILVGRVSVALNSAANPVVYLCRMRPLRLKLRDCRLAVLVRQLMVRRGWSRDTNLVKTNNVIIDS